MNPHKKYWPNENHNRWEELVGFSLAVAGVAVFWGFALGMLADQPIQHSGTQVHKVVAK